jgi:hypothetical protein
MGFLSHKAMPVSIKSGQEISDRLYCYSVTQEAYCWQVAPQQSLFPLQLPDTKITQFVKT